MEKLYRFQRILVLIFLLFKTFEASQSSNNEHDDDCPLLSSLHLENTALTPGNVTKIVPDANLIFTVFLPEIDCNDSASSEERHNSEIYLNAVSYAVELLNNVTTDPEHSVDSLLPFFPLFSPSSSSSSSSMKWPNHIKYGAEIVTVASTTENSKKMQNLVCKVQQNSDDDSSTTAANNNKIEDLALLDGSNLLEKLSGSTILEQFPVISLSPKDSNLNTVFKANLIVNLLETLDWKHFGIITTKHEDSLYIVKILGQIAHSGQICINDIFEWDKMLSNPNGTIENKMLSFLNNILRPNIKIPILILTDDNKQVSKIVRIFNSLRFENVMSNFQLFFSLVPSPELFNDLRSLSKFATVFTLNSQLPSIPDISSHVLAQKNCKASESNSSNPPPAAHNHEMWSKWLSFLPVRSILSVAYALNQALNHACKGSLAANITSSSSPEQPWCLEFSKMKRRHFFSYISALEDQLDSSLMTFGSIEHDGFVRDLLLYNGDQFRSMKTMNTTGADQLPTPIVAASNCDNSQCSSCIKFRQSRDQAIDDLDDDEVDEPRNRYGHHSHQNLHLLLNAQESAANGDSASTAGDDILQVETHEINLGLILPLHKQGSSVVECSREMNLPAYFVSEAAKWIVDKINQNNYLIPGIEVKLELIDTCSSSFFATQQLAQLTSSDAKVQPIAFVGSMPREHYRPVVDFVSSINYTMIATQDITDLDIKFGSKAGILQTSTTTQSLINVAVEQMKYFGWRYVTVVVNPSDPISVQMFHIFSEMAAHEKICFASVEEVLVTTVTSQDQDVKMNQTLQRMAENYQNGAQVVVLLTNYASTRRLTNAIQFAKKSGFLKVENFHFLSLRDQNLETIHGAEEEFMGSIFVRESIGKIAHFDNYFLDLLANPRPKDQNLFQFIDQCGENSAQCLRLINSFDRTVVVNTMQAILAIVGGFARMRNETCPQENGICNGMLETNFHRSLLNYILNTRSMRIDTVGERRFKSETNDVFEFTPEGSSGRDIELLNFKHDFNNGLFRFDTVGLWSQTTRQIIKNPNLRYIFYRFNGIIKGHKEYNETELISSDCTVLKKCPQCEPQTPEFIYMPSWDQLLITGVFDVHAHTMANPLICDKNLTKLDSVENVEAFIWAIEMINNDPDILPGVHLGALIFDTCSSYQKIYRDISNFLSNSLLLGEGVQMPTADSVVGFLVDGQNSKILDSILDLTNPLKISVISSQAREAKYQSPAIYNQFLGFSLPNQLYVSAMVSLLSNYKWKFISVLYENDLQSRTHFDAFQLFEKAATNKSIRFASKELYDSEDLHENLEHLKANFNAGSRVLVIFLSDENLKKFLEFNEALSPEKRLPLNETLLITIGGRKILEQFPGINSLNVDEEQRIIPEFREHFRDLSIQSNVKNPWFTKLWEKQFNCEGFGCFRTGGTLRQKNITVNGRTSTIINSVYTLAHALELLRQQLCPSMSRGLCRNFRSHQRQISRAEYGTIKQHQFIGLDGSHVAFAPDSNYRLGPLNLYNNHQQKGNWDSVGRYDAENGLLVSDSKTRAVVKGDKVTFSRFLSVCLDSKRCGTQSGDNSLSLPILKSLSQNEASSTIALILPLHGTGNRCEPLSVGVFERLLTFFYAVDMVNQKATNSVNILILDDCRFRKPIALQQLASVENFRVLPKIVSIVSLSEKSNVSTQLYSMLSDYSPFVYNFEPPQQEQHFVFQNPDTKQLSTNDYNTGNQLIRTLIDLCSKNHWQVVSLIYTNEFIKNYFLFQANENNICVEKTLPVTMKDIAKNDFKQQWKQFTSGLDSKIIILLTGSDVIEFLIKYSDQNQLDNFIWVGDQALKHGSGNGQKLMKKTFKKQIIVRTSLDVTNFDRLAMTTMLDGLTRYFDIDGNRIVHNSILTLWLKEYWMRKFHCQVSGLERPPCLDMKLARKALLHPKQLNSVYQFSKILASSIAGFLEGRCNQTSLSDDSCLLNLNIRSELKTTIIQQLSKNNLLKDLSSISRNNNNDYDTENHYEIEVLHNYGKLLNTFAAFQWNTETTVALNRTLAIGNSCDKSCDYCKAQLINNRNKNDQLLFTADSISSPLTSLSTHRNWAIAASILSTLGLIVVLICVLYFILIFPIQLGTTIIGYQILLGLFFCYLINFTHLLPISGSLCWVRINGLNLAYTIILSGLFVKSYNYLSQARMEKHEGSPLPLNSPLSLLSISGILILSQTAIILFIGPATPLSCSEFNQLQLLHRDTIIQLLLPGMLMLLTLGFSMKTLKNIESKWILVCSLATLSAWLAWLGFDFKYHRTSRSISIVIVNIIISSILIVLLYIRKLYLFSKISRKILKERRANMDAHAAYEPFADPQAQYGAMHTCGDSLSWSQSAKNGGQYRHATRSPFETDNEDNVSSCGSVKSSNSSSQVQTQELYPMDVYENQLGVSAVGRIGASTRSVYDIIHHESKDFHA